MKQVKWFKEGEMIPLDAKYLETKTFCVGYKDSGHPMLDDTPVYEYRYLYEIPVDSPKPTKGMNLYTGERYD